MHQTLPPCTVVRRPGTPGRSIPGSPLLIGGLTALACAWSTAAIAEEPLTIRQLAPARSFLIVSADDLHGTVERFKKTPLYGLWQTERVQNAVAEEWKEFQEARSRRLAALGLPEDTLSWPRSAGLAAYLDRNEELDTMEPVLMAVFDWGDGADRMAAFLDATIAELAREQPSRVSTRDIRGRKATVLALPEQGRKPAGALEGMGDAAMPKVDTLVIVRDDSRFLLTTDIYAMEDALTAIDVPPRTLVTDAEDARGALEQLGDGDLVAVLRTGPLAPLVEEAAVGPAAIVMPMLGQLFGDIKAYGFSATVDGSVGMLDMAMTIFAPGERKGLLALLASAPAAPAPGIVPADAIGYGRFNFAFPELMRVIEGVVAGLPEFMAQEIEGSLQMYGPTLRSAFAALGPEINVYTTVSQPITPESESNTVAITCSDEQAVLPLINMFAPMMGYESRDFVGNTIFSSRDIPMAIGFGGGLMIVGTTPNVEQALRAASQPATSAGGRSGAEETALTALPGRPVVSWGWYDTVAGLEVARQLMLAEAGGTLDLDDFLDQQGLREVLGVEKVPTRMIDSIRAMDGQFLSEFIGPQVWQFSSDAKGLQYRFSLLRPRKVDAR